MDLNIFNLESQSNEPHDQTLEVSVIHENFENETLDLNDEREAEYEKLFHESPNETDYNLPFESHPFIPNLSLILRSRNSRSWTSNHFPITISTHT